MTEDKQKNILQRSQLDKYHKCCGCIWYSRETDVLFCPFHTCVKEKKGFGGKDDN